MAVHVDGHSTRLVFWLPGRNGTTMYKRTKQRTILPSKTDARPTVETNLIREISQLAKYTGLNSETDLKQTRNELETEVKYFNSAPAAAAVAQNEHAENSGKALSIKVPIFRVFHPRSGKFLANSFAPNP